MRYERQAFDQGILKSSIVTILGSGELAQQLLVYLSALGVGNFRVVDYSEEEEKLFFAHVGEKKGLSRLETAIKRINKDVNIETVFHPFSSYLAEGVLVDTTNSEKAFQTAQQKSLHYIKVGGSDFYGSILNFNPKNKLPNLLVNEEFNFNGKPNHLVSGILASVTADEVRKIIHPLDNDKPLQKRLDYSYYAKQRFHKLKQDGRIFSYSGKVPNVLLVGVGGIGSYVAYHLAHLKANVQIYDGDKIEDHNLNRQIFYQNYVGKNKAQVIARKLGKLRKFNAYPTYFGSYDLENSKNYDVIFSCVDNWETRWLLNDFAVENKIPLIDAGVTAFSARMEMFIPDYSHCLDCRYNFDSLVSDNEERAGCLSIEQSNVVMNNSLIGAMMVLESLPLLYPRTYPPYHHSHVFKYDSRATDLHKFVFLPVNDLGGDCSCRK